MLWLSSGTGPCLPRLASASARDVALDLIEALVAKAGRSGALLSGLFLKKKDKPF
jgi:hypothetical protein